MSKGIEYTCPSGCNINITGLYVSAAFANVLGSYVDQAGALDCEANPNCTNPIYVQRSRNHHSLIRSDRII